MSSTATSRSSDAPAALALTPGEPAGIGPDLAILLATSAHDAAIVCYADRAVMAERARALGVSLEIREVSDQIAREPAPAGVLQLRHVPAAAPALPGRLDTRNARYVLDCLDAALAACQAGLVDGLVTGPIQKSLINDAGIAFSGHTEYLAGKVGAALPVMMLVADTLRVALVTTHVPLRDVPALVTSERVGATLAILERALREAFGLAAPRIAVCGLNPHAGEGGHLGREDDASIAPAVRAAVAGGSLVRGPLPADTAFTPVQRAATDAYLAMYHDQGLTVLKALGFGHAVNVTLGLPIVRTSVDHGTALDLAGSGAIERGSLDAAVALALELARNRRHTGA
jgi:4-hydroxythreonine-4-phosphate dehydrogenase